MVIINGYFFFIVLYIGLLIVFLIGKSVYTYTFKNEESDFPLILLNNSVRINSGAYVLLKRGYEIGAVRIKGNIREKNIIYPEGACYEWYYSMDGFDGFLTGEFRHGYGKVYRTDTVPIDDCSPGIITDKVIHCAFMTVGWDSRGWDINYITLYNNNIIIAPTEWTDIQKIDIHDESLKWYTYDK